MVVGIGVTAGTNHVSGLRFAIAGNAKAHIDIMVKHG